MPKAQERDGVYQRSDRPGWWVSYMDADGERVRRKVVASTRQQARDALRRFKTGEERVESLGVRPDSDITTKELMERFNKYQKPRVAASTYERLDGILETLHEHLPERAKDITRGKVNEYVDTRALTVKAGTVQKELFTLSKILRLAVDEWGLLNKNSAHGIKPPKQPEGRTRFLTPGELKAALEAAEPWMRAPMALAACTGCRRGELLKLRWMDVDLSKRLLTLRETKNNTTRILRIGDAAVQVFESLPQCGAGSLVFAGLDGQKLSVYCRRVFHKLGIMDASFHSLRHTMASWRVMEGEDLYLVGQILGHKTLRMTARYAHLSPEYMAKAAGTLDGIMGGVLGQGSEANRMLGTGTPPISEKAPKTASVSHLGVTRKSHRLVSRI